jgi:hypothetical protein
VPAVDQIRCYQASSQGRLSSGQRRARSGTTTVAAAVEWWYDRAMSDQVSTTRARFREALDAVHVLPDGQGWTVMQAGHEPETFPDREAALQAAKHSAALRHLSVLVHESGRATRTE